MNHKNWSINVLFLSLLLGTIGCLILPIDYQRKVTTSNQVVLKKYKKVTTQEDNSVLNYQEKYNDYLLKNASLIRTARPDFSIVSAKSDVIGTIEFPTVKTTETPIYKEKTKRSLFHYMYGSFPAVGKSGHLVITVDDQWRNQVEIVELRQLQVGDCFYLKMGLKKQAYQITTITKRDDQADRKIVTNEHLLTIELKNLTGFTNDQTTILSKRVEKKSVQRANVTQKINFSYSTIVTTFLLLNMLFFGGLVLSYQRYVRKAHANPIRTKLGGYRKLRRLLQITRGYYILLALIMGFYLAVMIYRYVYLG
ncbi:MAG: hypothetical protein ACLTXM_18505 [Enterococcus sp.]